MKIKVTVNLLGATRHDKETDLFVGFCPALNIYSQGTTEEEARKTLESAILLYVQTCFKKNILEDVLKEAGFARFTEGSEPPGEALQQYIKIEQLKFDRVFDMDIPLCLVAAQAKGSYVEC
jgi:predicted RNase H-like HicB family nuclease